MEFIKLKEWSTLLEDMSYNSKYEFLDVAKDKDELTKIAEKYKIVVPAFDIAIFKCIYGYTDRKNLNGCILPKEEVAKALPTLRGKAIDFDHLRKKVVGFWLDAEIESDTTIVAYGVFFKGNFGEDYEMIKDMMTKGMLGVSFESWGNRIPKDQNSYELTDIEFAGGALLPTTKPAFPGAGVLEMSTQRILEFASKLETPTSFIKDIKEKGSYDVS